MLRPRFFKVTWTELPPPDEASFATKSAYVVAKLHDGTYKRVSAQAFEPTRDIIAPPHEGAVRTYIADAASTDAYFATLRAREQLMQRASKESVTYGGPGIVLFAEGSLIFEPLEIPQGRTPAGMPGVPFVEDDKGILMPLMAPSDELVIRAPWTADGTAIDLNGAQDSSGQLVSGLLRVVEPYGEVRWLAPSDRIVAAYPDPVTGDYLTRYAIPLDLKRGAEALGAQEVVLDVLIMPDLTRAMGAIPGDGLTSMGTGF